MPDRQQHAHARRARVSKWASAVAAIAVLGLIVWGLLASRSGGPGGAGGAALPDFYSLAGQRAPTFTLKDLANRPVSLSEFRGQRVLLNFWYVDCPGCQQEMLHFERVYTQEPGQRVVILGINILDNPSTALRFVQQQGITYPIVLDPHQSVFALYHLTSTPSSIFIDSQGIIRGSVSGPLSLEQLGAYIQALS